MFRYLACLLCLFTLVCVGCATPAQQDQVLFQPQPERQENQQSKDKETTRIEFAVFGKLRDKAKEFRGRNDEPECTGPNCPRPEGYYQPQYQPTQQPQARSDGSVPLWAALSPVAILTCVGLGLAAFVITKQARDN